MSWVDSGAIVVNVVEVTYWINLVVGSTISECSMNLNLWLLLVTTAEVVAGRVVFHLLTLALSVSLIPEEILIVNDLYQMCLNEFVVLADGAILLDLEPLKQALPVVVIPALVAAAHQLDLQVVVVCLLPGGFLIKHFQTYHTFSSLENQLHVVIIDVCIWNLIDNLSLYKRKLILYCK